MHKSLICLVCASVVLASAFSATAAEDLTFSANQVATAAPAYIGKENGYFAEEGLNLILSFQTSAQATGMAVVSGAAPLGMTALTAGIYTIASQGGIKLIAGANEERPGFRNVAVVVNNAAYAGGIKTPEGLRGKKIGITQYGSPNQYQWARLAEKHGFHYADVRFVALQSFGNEISALIGGQVEAILLPASLALPVESRGQGKIITWMGDEVETQLTAVMASARFVERNPDTVVHFLRAYLRAVRFYAEAVQQVGADGQRIKGKNFDEVLRIIAKYTGDRPEIIATGLPYFAPQGRLAVDDIGRQVEVWKSLKMVRPSVDASKFLDTALIKKAEGSGP